jgi:cobalamin biosynthesis protein CobW
MRLVVQAVGKRLDSYFDRPWAVDEARATELVFIGSHLDRDELAHTLVSAAARG